MEQDTMDLGSQPGHRRIGDVPGFGLGVAPERVQNLQRDRLLNRPDIRFSLVGLGDAFGRG